MQTQPKLGNNVPYVWKQFVKQPVSQSLCRLHHGIDFYGLGKFFIALPKHFTQRA